MSTSGSKKTKYSLNTKDDFGRIGLKYKRKYFEEKEELEKKENNSKMANGAIKLQQRAIY